MEEFLDWFVRMEILTRLLVCRSTLCLIAHGLDGGVQLTSTWCDVVCGGRVAHGLGDGIQLIFT
jgi:hypothetical protein